MNMDALLKIKADVQGENNIRRFGNSLQGLQGQAKNAALSFNTFKTAIGGVAAAIAGSVIVGGLAAIVKKSIDAGDELFNLQAKSGIAANALIGIGNAAKLADVDMATLGKGITKLNVNLVKAAEGNEELARKFQALGIKLKTAEGQIVPADQALKQIADRFADMPDGAQKTAAAVALFGKAGADLIPLLNEGAASMEKFTYKIGEDFAARSDLFNDTITEFEIKTQGFALELTDALLPALQSILEVFGDLFDTKQDWSALFTVIIGGFRTVATVIYATIKLVDVAIKGLVGYYTAIGKVLKGDFAGAADVVKNTLGGLLQQSNRDFAQIQKIWTDAPSPGTGRRTGGRNMDLDTSAADAKADADAKKRAAEDKRRAAEAETLRDRINRLIEKGNDFTRSLTRQTQDLNDEYKNVGATPVEKIFNERADALKQNTRNINDLIKELNNYKSELEEVGMGKLFDKEYFGDLLGRLARAQNRRDNATELQGYKDSLPTLDSYEEKLKELTSNKKELTEVEQLNLQINSAQLDKLAETNPALATHLADLRERALLIDQTTQKQKDAAASFGVNFNESIKSYYDSINNLGADVGSAVVGTLQGLGDQLANFVTTGKLNFTDLANSIIKDMIRIATQQAIVKPLLGVLGSIFPGAAAAGVANGTLAPTDMFKYVNNAKGNLYAENGIQAFARGGIVDKPTLFPFAKGTGLMGEAGPEAIMPLKRGADGKLGVAADITGAMARYQRQGGDDNEPDPVAAMARYQRQDGGMGGMSSNRNTTNNANNITNNGYNTNGSNTTNNGYNTDGNNTTNNGYNTDGDNTTNNGYNTDGNNTTNNGYNTAGGNNTTNNQSNTNGNNTTNNRNNTNGGNTTNNRNDSNSNSDTVNNIQTSPSPVLAFSFETTRFLGQDYVSTDQLQAAMLATEKRAAASGAKAGAAQVAAQMRNSPGYRRQVGLR